MFPLGVGFSGSQQLSVLFCFFVVLRGIRKLGCAWPYSMLMNQTMDFFVGLWIMIFILLQTVVRILGDQWLNCFKKDDQTAFFFVGSLMMIFILVQTVVRILATKRSLHYIYDDQLIFSTSGSFHLWLSLSIFPNIIIVTCSRHLTGTCSN